MEEKKRDLIIYSVISIVLLVGVALFIYFAWKDFTDKTQQKISGTIITDPICTEEIRHSGKTNRRVKVCKAQIQFYVGPKPYEFNSEVSNESKKYNNVDVVYNVADPNNAPYVGDLDAGFLGGCFIGGAVVLLFIVSSLVYSGYKRYTKVTPGTIEVA